MIDFYPDLASISAFLASSVRLATPLGFATLGGVVAEKSGVYNVGLEGMILTGALGAAVGSYLTGSPMAGLALGASAGAVMGLVLAVLALGYQVNQLVAGIAVNLFCLGMTGFFSRAVFGANAGTQQVSGFAPLPLPLLSTIPVLGDSIFAQDGLVYLLIILAVLTAYVMFRTSAGLALRATGESPRAADSAGINVGAVRIVALAISGLFAGLAGCHLVLSQVFVFSEGISAGRGFIALAAVILGRWYPLRAIGAALFFGLCDAAQFKLQFVVPGVPYQIFQALPFLIAIAILARKSGNSGQPEAAGLIYAREVR